MKVCYTSQVRCGMAPSHEQTDALITMVDAKVSIPVLEPFSQRLSERMSVNYHHLPLTPALRWLKVRARVGGFCISLTPGLCLC